MFGSLTNGQDRCNMKTFVLGVAAAVCVLLLALPSSVAADCREGIGLSPPSEGEGVDGLGRAAISSIDSQQTFTVEVDLDVPAGTPLYVFANGEPAGIITFLPGAATLELSTANGGRLPSGLDPVCSIGPVWITDAVGTTLLTGSF